MRNFLFASLFLALGLTGFQSQPARKKILFFGDSITEGGAKPGGYIRYLDTLLQQKKLSDRYEVAGAGVSGNKVYDLYLRMDDDVLAKNPDAVVIWIGVNDVWHKRTAGTGTDPDKFERFYNAIIKKLKDRNITVFLCTPATIGEKTDMTNELDGDLNRYAAIIRSIATRNNCVLVDFRQAFHTYDEANNPGNKDRGILTTDGVHLNETGNRFVAGLLFDRLSASFLK